MRVRPTPLWPLAVALSLGAAVTLATGCGKSLPHEAAATRGAGVTTVSGGGGLGAGGLSTKNTTRLGGPNPVADAAAVALAVNPGLTPATQPQAVVLVDERNWPAALTAAALAGAPLAAPLLYSEGDSLPALSRAALAALRPRGAPALGGAQVIEIGTSAAPAGYRRLEVTVGPGAEGHATSEAYSRARTRAAASRPPKTTTTPTPTPTPAGKPAPPPREAPAAAAANETAAELAAQIEQILVRVRAGARAPDRAIVIGADGPTALAMPAAGLAAETGSPILPVGATALPRATRRVLRGMHHPAIYVVGPAAAVSETAVAKLQRLGTVRRIDAEAVTASETGARTGGSSCTGAGAGAAGGGPGGGASTGGAGEAVANSIAVARYSDGAFGWGVEEPGHGLVFASASRPLDAPAAAPLSGSGDFGPLLLLEEPAKVPAALAEYLCDIQPRYPEYEPVRGFYNHGWLIGDESAITARTQAELDAMLEAEDERR